MKYMKKRLLFSTILVAATAMSMQATDYYVSPTGSGSSYTLETPGKLTSTVIGKLKAGDNLYLRGGQYDLTSTLSFGSGRSGTESNYVTVVAYNGEKPVLDYRGQAYGKNNCGIKLSGCSYVHLVGITVRYTGGKGILCDGGNYNILENLDVYGCAESGIQMKSASYNMILNCDSHDNFDYENGGSSSPDYGGNADGFADKQYTGAGNIYIGCRSWGNSDDGWDSFQRVTNGTPTVYINCIAYANGPATFDMSNHPRYEKDKEWFDGCGETLSAYTNYGNPNGFKLGGDGTKHNTELYRCLAVGHRSKGFDQNNNAGTMKVINCTAYKNKYNYGFGNKYAYTLYVYNNVALAYTSGGKDWQRYDGATVKQGNNTWNTGFSCTEADFEGLDVTEIIFAERNADGTLPETQQFHLKASATNLIDKGKDFTDFSGQFIGDYVAYNGTAPDLGCYEYEGSSGIGMLTLDEGTPNPNLPRYNLSGQRVDDSYRGIVIQGGRKYFQK